MSDNLQSKEVLARLNDIRQTASGIKEESDAFAVNIRRLEQCLGELKAYWHGEAADAYQKTVSADIHNLKLIHGILSGLAKDYENAVAEYENTSQKAKEILNAIKEI